MGRRIPEGVRDPNTDMLPGVYLGTVQLAEEGATNFGDDSKPEILVYKFQLKVVEPSQYAGRIQFYDCIVGEEGNAQKGVAADPMAEDDETFKRRAGMFKKLSEKAGVTWAGSDTDIILQELVNKPVMWKLAAGKVNKDTGQPGRAKVVEWFTPGERAPEVREPLGSGGAVTPAVAPPIAQQPPAPPAGQAMTGMPPQAAPPQAAPPQAAPAPAPQPGYQPPPPPPQAR